MKPPGFSHEANGNANGDFVPLADLIDEILAELLTSAPDRPARGGRGGKGKRAA